MKKKKYYTVWSGREPGIYDQWEACAAQVTGFSGAVYKSFRTRREAETAFLADPDEYVSKEMLLEQVSWKTMDEGGPERNSISVDAACSGNPGTMEYRGVLTETCTEIFRQGPFPLATNNIGEFLAIVHALAWMKKNKLEMPVYSDSGTAITWVKKKQINTKMRRSKENEKVFELLQRAVNWLNTNTYNVPILKWETEAWGEIPADFGRKD